MVNPLHVGGTSVRGQKPAEVWHHRRI